MITINGKKGYKSLANFKVTKNVEVEVFANGKDKSVIYIHNSLGGSVGLYTSTFDKLNAKLEKEINKLTEARKKLI